MRSRGIVLTTVGVLLGVALLWWVATQYAQDSQSSVTLLNVSYDPTRELWKEVNQAFTRQYEQETGVRLRIKQSHGGSGSQARAVIDGLEADVVTLALHSDTDEIRKRGLLADGWEGRLPHDSLPYYSTIVFVVRQGNPKGIKDWPDLVRGDVRIITPNPKTSGNGKLTFLAAWGYVRHNGGSEPEAEAFVTDLYRRVPVLDTAARAATVTFAKKHIGDVHLTWENEAHLEVEESRGKLEIVYPSSSIRAEPPVAWVDANVERKGTHAAAEAYLRFLYTDQGQEIIAKHHYRPINPDVLDRHADRLRPLHLFPVTLMADNWEDAFQKFFGPGGVFDRIYRARGQ
ncbi:MAG: sulfate ABC transporter substrate-binding protein [Gemmataceae bacterium]